MQTQNNNAFSLPPGTRFTHTGQNGADYEARTRYLHLGKVALYQMSYARENKTYFSKPFPVCQVLSRKFIS